jgi:hypothetical protein
MLGITNWHTTAGGVAGLLTAAADMLNSYMHGTTPHWEADMSLLYIFWIGLEAKDKNVTGGTVPQTVEAVSRAESTPLSEVATVNHE